MPNTHLPGANALHYMHGAGLGTHNGKSPSGDFGCSAYAIVRHSGLRIPWLDVSARLAGEGSRVECAQRTCVVGAAQLMLEARRWRQERGVETTELEVQHHHIGRARCNGMANKRAASMAVRPN